MKFAEMLHDFRNEIAKQYGLEGPLKIALEPKLFEAVVFEAFRTGDQHYYMQRDHNLPPGAVQCRISLRDAGEFFIEGVQIVAREKDKF